MKKNLQFLILVVSIIGLTSQAQNPIKVKVPKTISIINNQNVNGFVPTFEIKLSSSSIKNKSKSINQIDAKTTSTNDSEGNIKINIDNKNFLLLNEDYPAVISTYTSSFMCAPEKIMNLTWKVIEIGTVGIVKISAKISDLNLYLNTPNTLKFLKVADNASFTTNVDYTPIQLEIINGVPQYVALYDFNGTKYFTYSELNAVVWTGNTNSWRGGSGINESPDTVIDSAKLIIIDAQSSHTNALINSPITVNCAWIKAGSKLVVNNNSSLTIQNQIQLDGELRMIGSAQLLQNHLGVSQISGLGNIYIDQLGTSTTTFRYNYWSSPVVDAGFNTFKVGTVMKDGTIPTSENSNPPNINFTNFNGNLGSLNGSKTSPITIASYWIFGYLNGSDWIQKMHTNSFTPPQGFIMKGPGDGTQNYTFVGSPNDGDYNSIISAGRLSLLGNPYPSALDSEKFIADNLSSILGTLYFWEMEGDSGDHYLQGYVGGYSLKNLGIGLAANTEVSGTAGLGNFEYKVPGPYIPVGQGFFVSSSTGGTVTFNNAQRAIHPIDDLHSVFFKSKQEDNNIINLSTISNSNKDDDDKDDDDDKEKNHKNLLTQLKLGFEYQNPEGRDIHRQIGLTFNTNNSLDFENGYDSYMFDPQPTDMFFKIKNDPSKYAVAGVGTFDKSLKIPVEINIAISGEFNFMIDYIDDIKSDYSIYLNDAVKKSFYNLSEGVKTLSLNSGIYQNRFFITFKKNQSSDDDESSKNNPLIYFDKTTSEIIICKKESIINKAELINLITNKTVLTWKNINDSARITLSVNTIKNDIYLIKLYTNKGLIIKKLMIMN